MTSVAAFDADLTHNIIADLQTTREYPEILSEALSMAKGDFSDSESIEIDGLTPQEWFDYLILNHDTPLSGSLYSDIEDLLETHLQIDDSVNLDDALPRGWVSGEEAPSQKLSDMLVDRGNIESAAANPEEAKKYYEKALEIDPTNERAWNNLGLFYIGTNDDLARTMITYAYELNPDNPVIRRNASHYIDTGFQFSIGFYAGNIIQNTDRNIPTVPSTLGALQAVPLRDPGLIQLTMSISQRQAALQSFGQRLGLPAEILNMTAEQAVLASLPEGEAATPRVLRALERARETDSIRRNSGFIVQETANTFGNYSFATMSFVVMFFEGGKLYFSIQDDAVSKEETLVQTIPTATATSAFYFSVRALVANKGGDAILAIKFGMKAGPLMGLTVTGDGVVGLTKNLVRDESISAPEYVADGMTVTGGLGLAASGGGLVLLGFTPPGWVVYTIAGVSTVFIGAAHFIKDFFSGKRVSEWTTAAITSGNDTYLEEILIDPHKEFDSATVSQLVWGKDDEGQGTFLDLVSQLEDRNPELARQFLRRCFDAMRAQIWISDKDAAALYLLGNLSADDSRNHYALKRTDWGDVEEYGNLLQLFDGAELPTVEMLQTQIAGANEAN